MELNKIICSVLFLTAGVVLTSCIEVNGSGYSDLSESEKLHVKKNAKLPWTLSRMTETFIRLR